MAHVTIELNNHLAQQLDDLLQISEDKDALFSDFIRFHQKKIKREVAQMQVDLEVYERRYQMDSKTFYTQFEAGQLDDSEDFILWSGIYEMQLSSKQKIDIAL